MARGFRFYRINHKKKDRHLPYQLYIRMIIIPVLAFLLTGLLLLASLWTLFSPMPFVAEISVMPAITMYSRGATYHEGSHHHPPSSSHNRNHPSHGVEHRSHDQRRNTSPISKPIPITPLPLITTPSSSNM
ncbi:MAG TPA: hypothetical protein VL461_15785 [Dictyobacter sp.]|nr:hypothetical protein [Dictyobacter sp.]